MFVACEQARSMSMFATMAADFDSAKERATAVAAAKVQIGKSLKFVGQQSIQLHGAIGMTDRRDIRTKATSANAGSALIAASVTGVGIALTTRISTLTQPPVSAVGSG